MGHRFYLLTNSIEIMFYRSSFRRCGARRSANRHSQLNKPARSVERKVSVSYYSQDNHGPFETYDLGDFELEEGGAIRGLKLAYATFGTLSPEKDNAIFFRAGIRAATKSSSRPMSGPGGRSIQQIFHNSRQSDRQRAFEFAQQYAVALQRREFSARRDRRRRPRAASADRRKIRHRETGAGPGHFDGRAADL